MNIMLLQIVLAGVAATTPNTPACPVQPMPTPLAAASFSAPTSADTILFSAAPSFKRISYAVQVTRPNPAAAARVTVLQLRRQWDCNRHDVAGKWAFTLDKSETRSFFGRMDRLEREWRDSKEVAADGTLFQFERRASGKVRRLPLSPISRGQTGELSALILSLVRRHLPADRIPRGAGWDS